MPAQGQCFATLHEAADHLIEVPFFSRLPRRRVGHRRREIEILIFFEPIAGLLALGC